MDVSHIMKKDIKLSSILIFQTTSLKKTIIWQIIYIILLKKRKKNRNKKNKKNKLCFVSFSNQWMNVNKDSTVSLMKMQKQIKSKIVLVCKTPRKIHCAVEMHN